MNASEIEAAVKKILADKLTLSVDKIDLNARLKEDLGMDSFGSVEIAFELEDAFKIKIPDEDIVKVVIVKDVVNYIAERLQKK